MANWDDDQWGAQRGYQTITGPNPGYSQPYAEPVNPPAYQTYDHGDAKSPYEGGRFRPKKRVNDPVFLVLFILQLLGYAALSGIAINGWIKVGGLGGGIGGDGETGSSVTLNWHTVYLLLLVAAAGLLLSTAYLMLVRAFTRAIMHITLILAIAANMYVTVHGLRVTHFTCVHLAAAIIFTTYFGFKSRIPLASLLLQVVMDISKHHLSTYFVAFSALLLQACIDWFVFTSIAIYATWTPGNPGCGTTSSCSSGKVAGLLFYSVFSYLWTSQVIGNVALATLAGGPYGCCRNNPTLSAFARASTLSLGSIAFGSLIVTILELIRLILNAARNNASQEGSPIEACLACCAELHWFDTLTRYAYIEIALYGKPYLKAAKDTYNLFKDRGIDALVNDSLVGTTLIFGAYVVGLLCSLFAYLYLRFTHPSYNAQGQYTAPVVLIAFLIGLQCSLTLSSAIEAGVSTIFVGLGQDPQVLAMRAPPLFAMIAERYPRVVQGVPRV
ncbi:plasma-membrane choline transporter-domain-containing protein [Pisolithus microcarpus]|nr:plasma-membrane choline transporter-domain-containing protein [Pisolithus microcarpus]